MILATGTVALDTTRTPFKTAQRVLGGSASYFSLAARFFSPVAIVGAVGHDFPPAYWDLLEKAGVNLQGLQKHPAQKTFFFDSTFSFDMYTRTANATELNVYENFEPKIPDDLKSSEYVYLGTSPPEKQLKVLREFSNPKFSVLDTIEFYIQNSKAALEKTISEVDGIVLNDIEARMLCNTPNIIKAAKHLSNLGPKVVIIKKGEHGSILFYKDVIFPLAAFPLESSIDPTGAGDSFSGGFMGHIARKGKLTLKTLKEAVAYGNLMGSFAIEDFSVDRLVSLTLDEIEKRMKEYRKLTRF
ncbi:MAG: PfkB family carbohydrate kinase [Candidatus Micrarchaeota archaeon]